MLACESGATEPVVTPFNGTHNAGIQFHLRQLVCRAKLLALS